MGQADFLKVFFLTLKKINKIALDSKQEGLNDIRKTLREAF